MYLCNRQSMAGSKLLTALAILAVMSLTSVVCFVYTFSGMDIYIVNSGPMMFKFDSLFPGHVHNRQSIGTSIFPDKGGTLVSKVLKGGTLNSEHPTNVSHYSTEVYTLGNSSPQNNGSGSQSVISNSTQSKVNEEVHTISNILTSSPPVVNEVKCSDKICSKYLSRSDRMFFDRCRMSSHLPKETDANPTCHFMKGEGRDPVGLVSVPGSGNTWVRGLLEKATGICTGAIYCDISLRKGGFLGEYVHSGSVLVVKTHTSDYQWKGTPVAVRNNDDAWYGSAILLIRNPYDTFVSEHNRLETLKKLGSKKVGIPPPVNMDNSHVHSIGEEYFGENPQWEHFIHAVGERWKKTIDKWFLHSFNHPIMVVRYEDVKSDQVNEVKKVLNFLGIQFEEETLYRRLQKDYQTFQRKNHQEFEHYTVDQKKYMNSLLLDTIHMLQEHNLDHLFKLEEYIAPIL